MLMSGKVQFQNQNNHPKVISSLSCGMVLYSRQKMLLFIGNYPVSVLYVIFFAKTNALWVLIIR